jgi:hypothetical protein
MKYTINEGDADRITERIAALEERIKMRDASVADLIAQQAEDEKVLDHLKSTRESWISAQFIRNSTKERLHKG